MFVHLSDRSLVTNAWHDNAVFVLVHKQLAWMSLNMTVPHLSWLERNIFATRHNTQPHTTEASSCQTSVSSQNCAIWYSVSQMQGTFLGEGVKLTCMYAGNQLFICAFELACIYIIIERESLFRTGICVISSQRMKLNQRLIYNMRFSLLTHLCTVWNKAISRHKNESLRLQVDWQWIKFNYRLTLGLPFKVQCK